MCTIATPNGGLAACHGSPREAVGVSAPPSAALTGAKEVVALGEEDRTLLAVLVGMLRDSESVM